MRKYSELSNIEKLQAILACSRTPLTIDRAIQYGEIQITREEIIALFTGGKFQYIHIPESDEYKFSVKPEYQQEVLAELDVSYRSVDEQISDLMLESLGLGFAGGAI